MAQDKNNNKQIIMQPKVFVICTHLQLFLHPRKSNETPHDVKKSTPTADGLYRNYIRSMKSAGNILTNLRFEDLPAAEQHEWQTPCKQVKQKNKLFEIEFEHNQTWNKMVIKVDGKTQQTRSPTSEKNEYLFEIGTKAALPCKFLNEMKKVVSITTTKQTNGCFKYDVKVEGRSLNDYKIF